MLQRTISKAPW